MRICLRFSGGRVTEAIVLVDGGMKQLNEMYAQIHGQRSVIV